jgi:transposase-like protein
VGIFKTFKNMKETAAEHGGMPNLRDSYTDISKTFDDRGEREILKTGITAMGIVRGFTTTVPGDRFAMSVPIEVHPPEGATYTIDYVFPTVRMQAAISAGMEIPIKISRDDPTKIAVQWDAQKAQIAAAGGSTPAVMEALAKTYGPATQAAMDQTMSNLRQGTGANPPPMTSQADPQSRIEKLEQLKNAGLIDDATYEAKKQKIIDEI